MKKMDEMDRNIQLRSESIGYRAAMFALAIWILYDLWNYWFNGGVKNILPTTLTTIVLLVQQFSALNIKRKMIAGDEEYKEPNQLLRFVILILLTLSILLSAGAYLSTLNIAA